MSCGKRFANWTLGLRYTRPSGSSSPRWTGWCVCVCVCGCAGSTCRAPHGDRHRIGPDQLGPGGEWRGSSPPMNRLIRSRARSTKPEVLYLYISQRAAGSLNPFTRPHEDLAKTLRPACIPSQRTEVGTDMSASLTLMHPAKVFQSSDALESFHYLLFRQTGHVNRSSNSVSPDQGAGRSSYLVTNCTLIRSCVLELLFAHRGSQAGCYD